MAISNKDFLELKYFPSETSLPIMELLHSFKINKRSMFPHPMPRRPKTPTTASYYISQDAEAIIDSIVSSDPERYKVRRRDLWIQKFYCLVDSMCDQLHGQDLDPVHDYVNINQDVCQRLLAVDNKTIAAMLTDLQIHGLVERDNVMKVAQKVGGKKIPGTGKSYGYRFTNFIHLVEVEVVNKTQSRTLTKARPAICGDNSKMLAMYREVMTYVTIPTEIIADVTDQIIANKVNKSVSRERYASHMDNLQQLFLNEYGLRNKAEQIPARGVHLININYFKPSDHEKTHAERQFQAEGLQCHPCFFEVRKYKMKWQRSVKKKVLEHDETTRCRIKAATTKIQSGNYTIDRKKILSRVCTPVTSLNREFRRHLLIDGRPIIGLDIRNSQPLLASILITQYWEQKGHTLPPDVVQYRNDCEQGTFYDHFMEINGISQDMRTEFKADFFRRVFFSKVTDQQHVLKHQFISRYPSCWTAICAEKGGLFSMSYGDFARKLQMVESMIIFDGVNMRLLEMGIKAFNIFDSIYVSSADEYETAKRIVLEEFSKFDITPTINPEYYTRE